MQVPRIVDDVPKQRGGPPVTALADSILIHLPSYCASNISGEGITIATRFEQRTMDDYL